MCPTTYDLNTQPVKPSTAHTRGHHVICRQSPIIHLFASPRHLIQDRERGRPESGHPMRQRDCGPAFLPQTWFLPSTSIVLAVASYHTTENIVPLQLPDRHKLTIVSRIPIEPFTFVH